MALIGAAVNQRLDAQLHHVAVISGVRAATDGKKAARRNCFVVCTPVTAD